MTVITDEMVRRADEIYWNTPGYSAAGMRAALEAVAPLLREAALREAALAVTMLKLGGGRWVKTSDAEKALLSLIPLEPLVGYALVNKEAARDNG